ncbi:MAG: Hsp70 family protein [Thermodesulfovibrionales bacterium]
MSEHFGIDFGTTNSAIVGISHDRPTYYGDELGQPYPSIIAIDRMTGNVVCRGREAWKQREQLRQQCEIITSVKTLLGSEKSWLCGTRSWTPEDVTSEILRGLKEEVLKRTRGISEMKETIISIPIGFSPKKRKSLRRAAKRIGLDVKAFVAEPTAAVYRKYSELKKWSKIAVFDWGGGTLDISVVEIKGDSIHEIATVGLRLGGDDFDIKIAEWAHNQVLKQKGGLKAFEQIHAQLRDRLIVRAEEAKRELSIQNETNISLNEYGEFGAINIKVDAKTLSNLLATDINDAVSALTEAIEKRAHMSLDELGCVLMVGGTSKLRGLYERIANTFPCEILHPEKDSDWHVAHGAAMLGQHKGSYEISQNIGLELVDNTYFPLYKKGEIVEHEYRTWQFGLVEDADNARFIFVEGHSDGAAILTRRNRRIDYLTIPTNGFIDEAITLQARIDEDLLLQAKAKSNKKGQSKEISWSYAEMRFSYKLPL